MVYMVLLPSFDFEYVDDGLVGGQSRSFFVGESSSVMSMKFERVKVV